MKVGDKLYRLFVESFGSVLIQESTINAIGGAWVLVREENPMKPGTFRLEPIFLGLIGKCYYLTRSEALDELERYVQQRQHDLLSIEHWISAERSKECQDTSSTATTQR